MNIDLGLQKIEELALKGLIQVPKGLKTFNPFEKFDTKKALQGAKLGSSIYLGLPQYWQSGSLSKQLFSLKQTNLNPQTPKEQITEPIIHKHALTEEQAIKNFIQIGLQNLKKLDNYHQNNLNINSEPNLNPNSNFQNQIRAATYQSWNNEQIDLTYFIQISGSKKDPSIFLAIDEGNPNGWAKNFKPKYKLEQQSRKTNTIQKDIPIPKKLLEKILLQSKTIFAFTPYNNIIIEGKVANSQYQQSGPMIIDLYKGYPNNLPSNQKQLTHNEHIDTAITSFLIN